MSKKRSKKVMTIRSVDDFDRLIGSERLGEKPRYDFDDPTSLGRELGGLIVERLRESRPVTG